MPARIEWRETDAELVSLVREHGNTGLAKLYGCSEHAVRSELKRRGLKVDADLERAGLTVAGSVATVVLDNPEQLGEIDTLLRECGLDPDEWLIVSATANTWDAMSGGDNDVVKMRQLKVTLRRKLGLEFIAPAADVKPRSVKPKKRSRDSRLVLLLPDPHAPYHDERAHEAVLRWLGAVQPEEVGLLGDSLDLPTVSRHRDNPAWAATVQECIQSAFGLLRDYTEACSANFWKLLGNHDVRLQTEILLRSERLFGISPASVEGEPQDDALSLRRLLHLDRLGIELVEPPRQGDNYEHAFKEVSPLFEARHGWLVGAKSAEKTLERVGRNIAVGHTHRQVIVPRTVWTGREHTVVWAMECGTLRIIEGGGGYAVNPNWQQGAGSAEVFADGSVEFDLARFDGQHLRWRGERF